MPKNKPNAFLAFMKDWKRDQERKGRTFPNGLKDVQIDPECNEEWRNMSEHEKAYYKEIAKNGVTEIKVKKKTGNGELVEEIKIAEQKKQEFRDNMIEYISDLMKRAKARNALPEIKFFVIHISYFYFRVLENNEPEYYPAEIAIREFSVKDGPGRFYNVIVNEKIRIGFTQSAKEQSDKTHQIPIAPSFGKTDFSEIFQDICNFLEPEKKNNKYPPMFTLSLMEDIYTCAKSVLSRIAIANRVSEDFFTLYSFEDFLSIMYNSIDENASRPIEPITALLSLKKDPFAYKPGLFCDYHERVQVGTLHCSHSLIQRWFFVLCDQCCPGMKIEMIQRVHLPKDVFVLTESLAKINISGRSRKALSMMSSSEVSYDTYKTASERTYTEEQRRRAEASARSLIVTSKTLGRIIDNEPVLSRPLRHPLTKAGCATSYIDSTDTESIDLSECSFPSIGRGRTMKKRTTRPGTNNGYADVVKY